MRLVARDWPSLVVALAAVLVASWPALQAPTRMALGGAWTEAPGHLWGLWTTATHLLEHGPLWRVEPDLGWPEGFGGHLIDPSSLLPFLPAWALAGGGASGAVLGWNLLVVGSTALGCLSTWALARRVLPDDAAGGRAVAVAVVGFAPFALAFPFLGRSEYLVCQVLPAVLLLLERWLAGGSRGAGLGATLLLGLVGSSTGYSGLFALLLVAPLALAALVALPSPRRTAWRLAPVALGSLLIAAPSLWALLADPVASAKLSDQGQLLSPPCALVRLCPAEDLAGKLHQPLVLGFAPAALALVGLARAPRRAAPWVALAGWLSAWGLLGHHAAGLDAVKEWSRVGAVLPLPLALAAGWAVRERVGLGLVLALAVAADGLSYPREAWPGARPAFEVAPPDGLVAVLDALPDGPVVSLPLERSTGAAPGFHALWARGHGRPISASLDGRHDVAGRSSGLVQATVAPASAPDRRCLRRDARALRAAGYVGVVVVAALPGSQAAAELLEQVLGPPSAQQGGHQAWELPEGPGPARWCY